MKKNIKNILQLGTIVLSYFWGSSAVFASSPSVKDIRELSPTDSSAQDLADLAQRYGCSSKFTQDNNSVATRDRLALGINNCWQELENSNDRQDIAIWKQLKQDYAPELSKLRERLDEIENNLTQLETKQFSTTTTLEGQILFFVADSWSENDASETFSGYRTRLNFNTSFFGNDRLNLRLESRNIGRLDDVTNTVLSRLSVDGSTEDSIELSELSYTFTPLKQTTITLGTTGVGLNDIGEVLNPFSSSSKGAISRFGRRNPATFRSSDGAGIGIQQKFSETISANLGYSIDRDSISNPEAEGGIFNSSASAIAQLVVEPSNELVLAVTYTHAYQQGDEVNLMGSTGLSDSNQPFGDNATTANNFGIQGNWVINSHLELGGWFGYTIAQQQENGDDSAVILNGAITLAFPDLFAENYQWGIIIGIPPTISSHDEGDLVAESTPLHLETFYRLEFGDRFAITPGFFTVFNPDTDEANAIVVGTIRTLFSF